MTKRDVLQAVVGAKQLIPALDSALGHAPVVLEVICSARERRKKINASLGGDERRLERGYASAGGPHVLGRPSSRRDIDTTRTQTPCRSRGTSALRRRRGLDAAAGEASAGTQARWRTPSPRPLVVSVPVLLPRPPKEP